MKINDELLNKAHEYLDNWSQRNEDWTDLAMMLDEGDTEMAADHMLGTGAVDSTNQSLDPEHAKIEAVIEQLGKAFRKLSRKTQLKRYDEVFKNCHLYSCDDCNHVSFVNNGNEKLYQKELKECWSCSSKNIEHKVWGDK